MEKELLPSNGRRVGQPNIILVQRKRENTERESKRKGVAKVEEEEEEKEEEATLYNLN